MEQKKLTTKQLSAAFRGFVNLFNANIAYKKDGEGFSKFVKEMREKQEEAK